MAETGHRTLEPADALSPAALEIASHTLRQYLDRSVASANEQLHGDTEQELEHALPNIRLPDVPEEEKVGGQKN